MELSKKQVKSLLDNINWEIEDVCQQFNLNDLGVILEKSLINYEGQK